jgi:PAS domain S-box-containing protein
LRRTQDRVLALSRTAAEVQALLDPDRVLQIIGDELEAQGLHCLFGLLDDKRQQIILRHPNAKADTVRAAEAILSMSAEGFGFSPDVSTGVVDIVRNAKTTFEKDLPHAIGEVIPDLSEEAAGQLDELLRGYRAISTPLVAGSEILGFLTVWSEELTEDDVPTVSVLAQQAAVALERANLYEDAMQRVFEMQALRKTTLDITTQLDLSQLLRQIVERAAALIRTKGGGLYLHRPDRNELELVVSHNLGRDYTGLLLRPGEGLSGKVLLTGERMVLEDYSGWENSSSKFDDAHFGGVVAVPLKWGERTIGVLNLTDGVGPRSFKDRELWLLEWFADHAAVAIENARLFAEREHKIDQLAALHEVSLEILAETDPSQLLLTIVQKASDLLEADAGAIDLFDPESQLLEMKHSHGYRKDYSGIRLSPGQGVAGMVCETRQPLAIDDYANWSGRVPQVDKAEISAALGVPLLHGDTLLGALTIDRRMPRPFDYEDIQLATLFANQAAIAIQNANTVAATRRRVTELTALREISLQLTQSLDLATVLDTIVRSAVTLVGASDAHIFLYDADGEQFTFGSGAWAPGNERHPFTEVREDGLTATVARNGEPVVINDARTHPLFEDVVDEDKIMEAVAGFPLKRADKMLGVFNVAFLELHSFDQDELRVLTLLADQAAIAVENARLYEETERRLKESQTLQDISQLVNSSLEPVQILQTVVERLASAFGYQWVSIYTMDENGLRLGAQVGYDPRDAIEFIPLSEGIIGRVARTAEEEYLSDVTTDSEFLSAAQGVVSEITVPIQKDHEVLGVLNVESAAAAPLTEADINLLRSLAHQVSVAIQNAQLYQAVHRELAERKQAEESYRAVVDHSLQGLLVLQDRQIVFANQALADLVGYTTEELLSLTPSEVSHFLVHPEDRDLVWGRFRERLAGKLVPPRYEYRVVRKDGSVVWVEMFANLMEYHGRPAIQAAIMGISERKQAEEALLKSEERYRSLFEDSRDAVCITTRQGTMVDANESFLTMFDVNREDLAHLNMADLYAHPGAGSRFQAEIEEKGSVRDYEVKMSKTDGTSIEALISATLWRDADGNVLGYRGIIRDVTERKRAQEELQQSYLTLTSALKGTVDALAALAEIRDPYTAGHQQRVARLATTIAVDMGLSGDLVEGIRMAGVVHDIGKIHVPAEILSKPTKLTDIEWQMIKMHPQTAYDILRAVKLPWPVAKIVLQHHERMNGSGYPNGLSQEEILLEARILAVADVVEAMASDRPYRPAHGVDEALAEIEEHAGTLYDRQVVEVCLKLFRGKRFDLQHGLAPLSWSNRRA